MKKILLASAATFAFATSASAYDLIHPFYEPSEGKITSKTSYNWSFAKANTEEYRGKEHIWNLSEDLTYGIQDNWTVYAGLDVDNSRIRNFDEGDKYTYKFKETTWYLGSSYNIINDDQQFLKIYGGYYQTNSKYRESGYRDQETFRVIDAEIMYGWNFNNITLYTIIEWYGDINYRYDKNGTWDGFIGAYKKLTDKLGVTLGMDYNYATNKYKYKTLDAIAKVGYIFTDKVALELKGSYMLDESVKHTIETDKAYGVTASVKFEF